MARERDDRSSADARWRSYRCPVCGHADEVTLSGEERLRILCSHCDTALTVEHRGSGERLSVQVAGEEPDDR